MVYNCIHFYIGLADKMVAVKAIPETYTALSVETIKAAAVKRVDWGMVWCK
jgi:hypothetical protein